MKKLTYALFSIALVMLALAVCMVDGEDVRPAIVCAVLAVGFAIGGNMANKKNHFI